MQKSKKLQEGEYYWVKYCNTDPWEVGLFMNGLLHFHNNRYAFTPSNAYKIGNKINPPQ